MADRLLKLAHRPESFADCPPASIHSLIVHLIRLKRNLFIENHSSECIATDAAAVVLLPCCPTDVSSCFNVMATFLALTCASCMLACNPRNQSDMHAHPEYIKVNPPRGACIVYQRKTCKLKKIVLRKAYREKNLQAEKFVVTLRRQKV